MFQMQHWSSNEGVWAPMEDGAASKVWQPRDTGADAVRKCMEWTGLASIPAMRVLDLDSGEIVWADTSQYPNAGECVAPDWAAEIADQVLAEQRAERETEELREHKLPLGGRYCDRVDEIEHDSATFREGDVVRYRYQKTTKRGEVWTVGIATLRELYIETHPNVDGPRAFAEGTRDGEYVRIWFLRDKPEHYALGDTGLAAPEAGMLW